MSNEPAPLATLLPAPAPVSEDAAPIPVTYAHLMAATATVLEYCCKAQPPHLLAYGHTEAHRVKGGQYINIGAPQESIERVAIAARGAVVPFDASADAALAVAGVSLAVDAATLGVGEQSPRTLAGPALEYIQEDRTVLRLVTPVAEGATAYVDGRIGWGKRFAAHGHGWPDKIGAGDDGIHWQGGLEPPAIGTVLQWDREVMAVTRVVTGGVDTEVYLDRGLAGTKDMEHASNVTAYTIRQPHGLEFATRTVAERVAYVEATPGAGPIFDPDGDATPYLLRNLSRVLAPYVRR